MKNLLFNLAKQIWFLGLLFSAAAFLVGCNNDDDDMIPQPGPNPVASFQFEVSMDNFLEVTFTNFSQNATSYEWDFGDGNTSTEKDPVHTYDMAGTYTVELTASNDEGATASFDETITITDPNEQLSLLAGEAGNAAGKTWYLQREGIALGIGPAVNDNQWWSFGGVTPLAERPCILDDSYTFYRDGTFEFSSNGTFFMDLVSNGGWEVNGEDQEACLDESMAGVWGDNPDRSAFGDGGDYTFTLDNAQNILEIMGMGAYIGLVSKTNGGDNPDPVDLKTYTVFNLAEGSVADTLHLALQGEGFSWNFYMVSYHDPADLPEIPTEAPVFGEDYPDISPEELFNGFSAADDFILLDTIVPSGSTIEYGVDDPADASAAKVGQFNRTDAQFQELQFQTKPMKNDINFENLDSIFLEVYLPSSNDYSGSLNRQVIIGIGDKGATAQWWQDHYQYESEAELPLDQWITLKFDLSEVTSGAGEGTPLDRNDLDMFFINIGGSNHADTGTFYVRNFRIE